MTRLCYGPLDGVGQSGEPPGPEMQLAVSSRAVDTFCTSSPGSGRRRRPDDARPAATASAVARNAGNLVGAAPPCPLAQVQSPPAKNYSSIADDSTAPTLVGRCGAAGGPVEAVPHRVLRRYQAAHEHDHGDSSAYSTAVTPRSAAEPPTLTLI
jgi:hypothetical protein